MKNLPIGISNLQMIKENNMIYIDKTKIAYNLIINPGRYFLSRPRRFGKSLFLDTLKEIFDGNKELFKGLFVYDNWNWDKKYPVIKIDFAGGTVRNRNELDVKLKEKLNALKKNHTIHIESETVSGILSELISSLATKYSSKVVILIDEYDKPLLDNIENPEMAMDIRDGLKNFYSVIKEQDANIQFVFLTGVSKFSKVNIFSGINNLEDITLHKDYSTICGYTQDDLEIYFKEHLEGVDRELLKTWYNGYNFLGEKVYNPYDILLFISNAKTYRNYWFETGTPTFLIKLFQKNNYFLPDLDDIEVGEEILSSFEIDRIEPATLLFQSGYLTIKEVTSYMGEQQFKLSYPNIEVKRSLNKYLISGYTNYTVDKLKYEKSIYENVLTGNFSSLEKTIIRLFAGIPYRNVTKSKLHEYEGYYASVLYAFFSAINCEVIPEDITNHGQADMTIKLGNTICVMEIKAVPKSVSNETENTALKQIQEMDYAAKYLGDDSKTVYELGLVFDMEKRNLVQFDWYKRD
ncbi:MAG: hypothetical protein A2015_13820 [Spirochaetes bacterium GWF1_31_7]|nr:MAG: hypothetical protein A2Y30_11005 [Spirochaetes bacterium GWE1_32_154]OHD46154.1 MAG: hypothetical protein A2Y29_08615 [Spirochaetes bacterium GWE2_31_10]OHD49895.1 MAG: hypothetical protein A2015_13820 [Spirochaetes bacterium GWF1_31_7]HBD96275.1 hypothetical protein [Spirochaetia bacterium]HBI37731.1 hypothetical protein [Spirochaetia bacterium]